jgi:zinc protease
MIVTMQRLAFLGLFAIACTYRPPSFTVSHSEKRGRLDHNGLRFVVMPDPGARLAEVAMRYDVGAEDDPDGKAGLAHLVEHLMFILRPPGEAKNPVVWYLDQLSTRWNAYTTYESTHYMALGSQARLDALLQIEALRLRDGCKSITQPEFEREREVVRNEVRQRTGTPEGQIERLLAARVYPRAHPYARTVGGDDAQIAALTLADACDFIAKYYVPERATLIVAGRIEVDPTLEMIQKWFGGLEKRAPGSHPSIKMVAPDPKRVEIPLDIERPIVAISWPLPARRGITDELVAVDVSSRLAEVVRSSQLYEFGLRITTIELGGRAAPAVTLLIELTGMDKLDQALDFTWKAARTHRSLSIGMVELPAQFKSRVKAAFMVDLEPLEERANKVADLIQFTPDFDFLGAQPYVFHTLDAIEAVDIEQIFDKAKTVLDPDHAVVTVFKPSRDGIKGDARASFTFADVSHELDKSDVDPSDATRKLELPVEHYALSGATRFELANGLHVVLLPVESSLPIVTASILFDTGEVTAGNPLLPVALTRFAMLDPVARRKIGRAGLRVGCRSSADQTLCSTSAMGIYLPEMIQALERRFKMTDYEPRELERWQRELAASAGRRQQIARDEFEQQALAAIFGHDHPYTRTGVKRAGTENAIDRDSLLRLRDDHFNASNATVVIAGTFDRKYAESLVRDAFDNWSRGTPIAAPPPTPGAKQRTYVGVVRDEGPQLEVEIEYPSPPGIGGQQAARLVIAEMLSIEAKTIRQQLGATYGFSARREERRGPSRYVVRGSIDAPRAGEALQALRTRIEALRRGEDFETTFVRARRKVAQDLLDESAASSDLATRLATIAGYGLPDDYYDKLIKQVAALTPTQTKALIAKELAADGEAVIATADRATLVAAFQAAGITDYKIVEPTYHH